MNFIKITVSRNYGWKFNIGVICVSFDNINPWHVYSFAYDGFNWCDGIRYSYVSFCAKSASISLVDIFVDIVASKKTFRQKFQVELEFICAEFQILLTFSKHNIIILVGIFHGNRSLTT